MKMRLGNLYRKLVLKGVIVTLAASDIALGHSALCFLWNNFIIIIII